MPAMLLLALQRSLLEARLRLFRAALASCASRFPLHRIPLCRERLLRLGAHRRLLKGFRRLAGAPLGVLHGLDRLGWIVTEEGELLPFADNELQDLLIGWLRAEDNAGDVVPSVRDMLRLPDPELAIIIYGQGGRHADLHGWYLLYVDGHSERGDQGGRLLMRISARPRPPGGDCVFISDARIAARADAPFIAAGVARPGSAPRLILVHIAFPVSKL